MLSLLIRIYLNIAKPFFEMKILIVIDNFLYFGNGFLQKLRFENINFLKK